MLLPKKTTLICIRKYTDSKISSLKIIRHQSTEMLPNVSTEKPKPFKKIPGPTKLPLTKKSMHYIWGNYERHRYHEALLKQFQKYGPIVKENISGRTVVHLFDPDDINYIYKNEGKLPQIKPLLETSQFFRKKKKISGGLGNTNGEEWYRIRHGIQQIMMQISQVKKYFAAVCTVADDFVQLIKDKRDGNGQVSEFYDELMKWSLESSGFLTFGMRLNYVSMKESSEARNMVEANKMIFEQSVKLKFSPPMYKYVFTPTYRKLHVAEEYFYEIAKNYVNKTIQKMKHRDPKPKEFLEDNFLANLLRQPELTYEDRVIMAVSLFGDGLSTTVPTIVYNLFLLAKNPHIQEKVYQELTSLVAKDEPLTSEKINKLIYFKACIKEAFRMLPISTEVIRVLPMDTVLSGYLVPAGTVLHLNHFSRLRSPEYFPNPDQFIPERWLTAESKSEIPSVLMTPFSHGIRTCAGKRFAEQDLQILLLKIIKNFRIEYEPEELRQIYRILLFPELPTDFTFIDRH